MADAPMRCTPMRIRIESYVRKAGPSTLPRSPNHPMSEKTFHPKAPIYLFVGIAVLVMAMLGIGLSALLFHLGETRTHPLGPNGEYIGLQISLYHLREVTDGGDYYFVIGGAYHRYEIIPIAERLGHAIQSLFTLNWSYATCMGNTSLLLVTSVALRGSLLSLLFLLLAASIALFARYIPKLPIPLYAYYIASGLMAILAFLSPLWSKGIGYPTVFLTLALLLALFPIGNRRLRLSRYIGIGMMGVGIAFVLFHLIGLCCDANRSIYSLSTLLMQGIKGKDNHTYALSTLFLWLYTLIPFAIGAYALVFAYRHDKKEAEKNAPIQE